VLKVEHDLLNEVKPPKIMTMMQIESPSRREVSVMPATEGTELLTVAQVRL
jgi:hypothetical protein